VAAGSEACARHMREALVETLVPVERREEAESLPCAEYIRVRVQAIHSILVEIIHVLHETA
jgi:hypothetical protein